MNVKAVLEQVIFSIEEDIRQAVEHEKADFLEEIMDLIKGRIEELESRSANVLLNERYQELQALLERLRDL